MRILAISDEPSGKLWGSQCREALTGVDMILSAGDLPPAYLSFLTCFTNAPVIYMALYMLPMALFSDDLI